MRCFRYPADPGSHLVVETGDGRYDLSATDAAPETFADLATIAEDVGASVDDVASSLADDAEAVDGGAGPAPAPLAPAAEEVWAAGVTYEVSRDARDEESGMGELYRDVYESDRPELFFKATPSRTVGPGEAIGVREDSEWDVPEPELGVVCVHGEPVGYTVGNDVSSRDLEGQNPLYLPQAKVYERCCALGPCVSTDVDDPRDLEIAMTIERGGEAVFSGSTSTDRLVREPAELVDHLADHDVLPAMAVLLTGTSLVPSDDVTLRADDRVEITIDEVGTLVNLVTEV